MTKYIFEILGFATALFIAFRYRKHRNEQIDELNEYAQETDNIPVISYYRNDPSVKERERDLNDLIVESGNTWGIQAIGYPMLPSDSNYGNYLIRIGKLHEKARDKRHGEIKKEDPKSFLSGILKQRIENFEN